MIIFINGTINSGKSTIAKLLQEMMPNTAVVEPDSLRAFVSWLPIESAIEITLKNAVSVVKNFANAGFTVVVPYPLSQKNYEYVSNELADFADLIRYITLTPEKIIVSQNRGSRELSDWEQERIQRHFDTGLVQPKFGIVVNNSVQSPKETVAEILQRLAIQ